MTFVSYAQNFEDVMLWRALRDVGTGSYLDVGAQDPVVDSVSRAFYDTGWRGVHVEPTPHYARALRENRPDELVVKAVVSTDPGLRTFYEIPGTGLSTGVEEIAEQHRAAGWEVVQRTVPSVPLTSLLDQFDGKDIHWLKIDVEGMELDVLRSWGDHPARPWILVIESTYPNTQKPTHHAWIDEVTRRGYSEVYFDGLSRYFLAETQMERTAAFATPPNVFDQFHVERHHFASGLVRQGEEAMQRHMAETEQKASEQEQRHQLELAQREEASGQRDARHHAQVEHLQHALRELEQAQDHFPAIIDEKEGEIALLRQQLDHLRASHDEARERFKSDLARGEEAHRTHVGGLETTLAVAQAAIGRLGLELDRREAGLTALRKQAEDTQARAFREIGELRAALSDREADLRAALDSAKEIARASADREHEFQLSLKSLEDQLDSARRTLADAEQSHGVRLAELNSILAARTGELATARKSLEDTQASAAERERQFHRQLDEKQTELTAHQQALEQHRAESVRQATRLDGATALLFDLQSGRLWRRTWRRRNAIDMAEFTALMSRAGDFLSQPAQENIAAQKDALDCGLKFVTASAMSIDIATPNAPRATTLDELLSHHDLAFVRCAYRTVLGREPDPAGEAYYLARLRSGVAKLHILRQLRRCDEASRHDPCIAGLDRAIRRYWRGRMPLIGVLVRLWTKSESDSRADRRFRALANDLGVLRVEQAVQSTRLANLEKLEHGMNGLSGLDSTLYHVAHTLEHGMNGLKGLDSTLYHVAHMLEVMREANNKAAHSHTTERVETNRLTAGGRNIYLRLVSSH